MDLLYIGLALGFILTAGLLLKLCGAVGGAP